MTAVQAQRAGAFVQRQAALATRAEDAGAALGDFGDVPVVDCLAVMGQRNDTSGAPARCAAPLRRSGRIGLLRLEEFAPGRGIEVQVLTSTVVPWAPRMASRTAAVDPRRGRRRRCARSVSCDTRRWMPALRREIPAWRHFPGRAASHFEVAWRASQRQLFRHAAAAVGDGDAFDAALFQPYRDLAGAGVQRFPAVP